MKTSQLSNGAPVVEGSCLYTRNPAAERRFLARVLRNAKKLKADLLTGRAVF